MTSCVKLTVLLIGDAEARPRNFDVLSALSRWSNMNVIIMNFSSSLIFPMSCVSEIHGGVCGGKAPEKSIFAPYKQHPRGRFKRKDSGTDLVVTVITVSMQPLQKSVVR